MLFYETLILYALFTDIQHVNWNGIVMDIVPLISRYMDVGLRSR